MKTPIAYALLACTLLACGSAPSRIRVSDVIQVRPLATDDPLATKFDGPDGEEIRLGDPILNDRSVDRCIIKPVNDTQYDLVVTVGDVGRTRWRSVAEKKRELALLVSGRVVVFFKANQFEENKAMKFTVERVASAQKAADELQNALDRRPTFTPAAR